MGTARKLAATSAAELKFQLEHPSTDDIWARAVEVFGNKDKANTWMNQARAIFNNGTPRDLAESGEPAQQRAVLESLIAIDCGLFT